MVATAAAPATPVPLRGTVCGLPVALSTMVTLPVRGPATSGVKVTSIVHEPPAATDGPQLELNAKSPEIVMDEIASGAEPVFASVTVCAGLVVETVRDANVSDVGVRLATGAGTGDTLTVAVMGEGFEYANGEVIVKPPAGMVNV